MESAGYQKGRCRRKTPRWYRTRGHAPLSPDRRRVRRARGAGPRHRTGRSFSALPATASTPDRRSPRRGAPHGPRVLWRKTIGAGFSGPVVVQGRVILFHRLGERRDRRRDRCADRRGAVALRVSDCLPRRLRLRRGSARGAGGGRRRRLHVRRRGAASRDRPRERDAALERRYEAALRGAEGVLRRGRLAARGRGPRDRQRRRAEGRHRRLRGENGQGAVDRDRRRGQLFVADRRDDRRTALRASS